ncbi:MAG TPA: hypothetical protein VGB37_05325 [Candidatus Lokiarchaeia archaeon]
MTDFIENLKIECRALKKANIIELKDVKAIYCLWNDKTVSRRKLQDALKRSTSTMQKLDRFINEYLEKNKIKDVNDEVLQNICNAYKVR